MQGKLPSGPVRKRRRDSDLLLNLFFYALAALRDAAKHSRTFSGRPERRTVQTQNIHPQPNSLHEIARFGFGQPWQDLPQF